MECCGAPFRATFARFGVRAQSLASRTWAHTTRVHCLQQRCGGRAGANGAAGTYLAADHRLPPAVHPCVSWDCMLRRRCWQLGAAWALTLHFVVCQRRMPRCQPLTHPTPPSLQVSVLDKTRADWQGFKVRSGEGGEATLRPVLLTVSWSGRMGCGCSALAAAGAYRVGANSAERSRWRSGSAIGWAPRRRDARHAGEGAHGGALVRNPWRGNGQHKARSRVLLCTPASNPARTSQVLGARTAAHVFSHATTRMTRARHPSVAARHALPPHPNL